MEPDLVRVELDFERVEPDLETGNVDCVVLVERTGEEVLGMGTGNTGWVPPVVTRGWVVPVARTGEVGLVAMTGEEVPVAIAGEEVLVVSFDVPSTASLSASASTSTAFKIAGST